MLQVCQYSALGITEMWVDKINLKGKDVKEELPGTAGIKNTRMLGAGHRTAVAQGMNLRWGSDVSECKDLSPAACLGKGWREGPIKKAMEKKGNTREYAADPEKFMMDRDKGRRVWRFIGGKGQVPKISSARRMQECRGRGAPRQAEGASPCAKSEETDWVGWWSGAHHHHVVIGV